MTKYITEMLQEINKDPAAIAKYKNSAPLKFIFAHAFDPAKKFMLPEGDPPFKRDGAPLGMSPGNLMIETKRLYVFCRKDLNPIRREVLFVQLLESVHSSEADLLLAVKDQNLEKIYTNITHKFVFENGMIDVAPAPLSTVTEPKKEEAKRGRGRPRKVAS